jgi:hypothetical protein
MSAGRSVGVFRKHGIAAILFMVAAPGVASAQSWTAGEDGSIVIPASVAGAKLAGAEIVCLDGRYDLVLPGVTIGGGNGGGSPVALLVDGSVFATAADAVTGAIPIPETALPKLKSGKRMTLSFASGAMQVETSFSLKGSSKALEAAGVRCRTAAAGGEKAAPAPAVDVALEFKPTASPGSSFEVVFKGPNGSGDWIGLAPVGSSSGAWVGSSYAYASSGSPARFPLPTAWGSYEMRYVTGDNQVLLSRPLEIMGEGDPSLDAPADAAGGSAIQVSFAGPGGSDAFIAFARPDDPASANLGGLSGITGSPVTLRVPLEAGIWELRYVSAGAVVASRPIVVMPAPTVTIAAMDAVAGQSLSVDLPDAPRTPGDYLYISRNAAADSDYGGGYVGIPATGPAIIPAPREAGDWELKYMVPAGGSYAVLGRARLTVR